MNSEFQAKLNSALRNARSNSKTLSAFAIDAEHYLYQTRLFSHIQSKKTSEPHCAMLVRCQLQDPSTSMSIVAERLQSVWADAPLGYGTDFDAYYIYPDVTTVHMNFVTMGTDSIIVTGEIVVAGFGP